MVIKVDTAKGQISVESGYSLGELVAYLSYFYPDFEWQKLKTGSGAYFTVGETEQESSKQAYPYSSQKGK